MRHRSRSCLVLLTAVCVPLLSFQGVPWDANLREYLASCPAHGCGIQLERGVYEISEPLWIGRVGERTNGWRIRGRGRGIFSSSSQRTNCATTIRYVGPFTGSAMVNVVSTRYGALEDLCLDLNGRASGDIEFHCSPETRNCGDFRVAVVSGGWPANTPGTFGPRALPGRDGSENSWEAVTFDHYQQHFADDAPTMAPPRVGMHLGIRNADHWRIESSKLAFTGDGAGILVRAGNFTLLETVIRSDATATAESCAVKVESASDRLAIVGLTTELRGRANGLCGCRPDPVRGCLPAIMAVSVSGSEIKVPKGSAVLDWRLGGSLAVVGTVLGFHGGGEGRIRVHVEPTSPLRFLDNFYRMSLLDVTILGDVE